MKISLDEKDYELSDETTSQLIMVVIDKANEVLDTLPNSLAPLVFGAESILRKQLYDLERKAVKAGVDKDIARKTFRLDGKSPIEKFMEIIAISAKEISKDVEVQLGSDGRQITSFAYQYKDKSKAGG